jgi:hypothetical protein
MCGEWAGLSNSTHIYNVNIAEPAISDSAGKNAAWRFVDDELRPLVNEASDNPKRALDNRLWHYAFFNESYAGPMLTYGLYVRVSINSVSGKVAMYYEVWSSEFSNHHRELFAPIQADGKLINASEAQIISRDFLLSHNYTLPRATRIMDTRLEYARVDSEQGQPENWSRPIYHIELAMPNGNVFPVKWLQGVLLQIDATTGRVFRFEYMALKIPELDTSGLIDVGVARNTAAAYVVNYSGIANYTERRVCLRLEPSVYSLWEFRLAWTFEYESIGPWGTGVSEYPVDARTGESLLPLPQFSGGGVVPRNSLTGVTIACLVSLFCAACGFFWMRKHLISDHCQELDQESCERQEQAKT